MFAKFKSDNYFTKNTKTKIIFLLPRESIKIYLILFLSFLACNVAFLRKPGCISYKFLIVYIPDLTKKSLEKVKITSRSLQELPGHARRRRSERPSAA
jgi:hypothetical protein